MNDQTGERRRPAGGVAPSLMRQRIILLLVAGWTVIALLTEIFVNSGWSLDLHDQELDGAIGGLAFSFNAVPLSLLYIYCSRDPAAYFHIFWLAFVHQIAIIVANFYHLSIGTFSAESIIAPVIVSTMLAALAFSQIFDPPQPTRPGADAGQER
jgi:hypothetical protein